MDVIYTLIPGMMIVGLVMVAIVIWAVRKGQYEDMEGNSGRILMDDDEDELLFSPPKPDKKKDGEPPSSAP